MIGTSKNFYLGREIMEQYEFTEKGTFESLYKAQEFLRIKGYCWGSSSRCSPIPIVNGKEYNLPQKWINFNQEEKNLVDGVLISSDFREGTTTIILF